MAGSPTSLVKRSANAERDIRASRATTRVSSHDLVSMDQRDRATDLLCRARRGAILFLSLGSVAIHARIAWITRMSARRVMTVSPPARTRVLRRPEAQGAVDPLVFGRVPRSPRSSAAATAGVVGGGSSNRTAAQIMVSRRAAAAMAQMLVSIADCSRGNRTALRWLARAAQQADRGRAAPARVHRVATYRSQLHRPRADTHPRSRCETCDIVRSAAARGPRAP